MGRNKAVVPDQIPIEAWTCPGDEGLRWLTCLFNKIFSSAKMPDDKDLAKSYQSTRTRVMRRIKSDHKEETVIRIGDHILQRPILQPKRAFRLLGV
ncbi:hypothetical protein Tco_0852292 [Tanacetum coccineum]